MEAKKDPFDNQITPEQVQALGKGDKSVSEATRGKKDTVVVLNGRMNPPTKGHEENIQGMHKLAKEHNADHVVIASHSHDSKKNPLSPEQKQKHLQRAFPDTNIKMASKDKPTLFHHLSDLHKQGYKHVVLAAGSDREEDYQRLKDYNGKEGKHGYYNFKSIKVASTGERKAGISGTDLRNHVKSGNYAEFKKNLPSKIQANEKHSKELFNDVHKGLSVNEEYLDEQKKKKVLTDKDIEDISDNDLENHVDQHYDDVVNEDVDLEDSMLDEAVLTLQQRLKRARAIRRIEPKLQRMRKVKKMRMATQDVLARRARKLAVLLVKKRVAGARGLNYSNLSASEKITIDRLAAPRMNIVGRVAQRLMPIIRRKELARLKQVRGGKADQVKVPTNIQAGYDPRINESFELLMQEDKQMKFNEYLNRKVNKDINEEFESFMAQPTLKEEKALRQKAEEAKIDYNLVYGIYTDAINEWTGETNLTTEQFAFNRVNTFIANENYYYKDVEKVLSGQGNMTVVEGEDVEDTSDYKVVIGKDGKKYKVRTKHLTFVKEEQTPPQQMLSEGTHVRFEEGELEEKHLTSNEKKKREEIAQAIEKQHPGYSVMKKMAIATAQAKKVAEETFDEAVTADSLKKHPMYHANDMKYLTDKGYKPHEIKKIWDRDHARGQKPVSVNKNDPSTFKEEKQVELGDLAVAKKAKHRFLITYTDPHHTMKSKRTELQQKHIRVPATNKNGESVYKGEAEELAKKHMKKQGYKVRDIEHVGLVNVSEEVLDEAVTVKKEKYSWGNMMTVHHGAETSYPLHPEHQKAIARLRDGDKTSFKDETNRNVHVHREGDNVHLMSKEGNYKPTTVSYKKHFSDVNSGVTVPKEEVDLGEAHKLGDQVVIHKGPSDVLGKKGRIGEIRNGAYKGAPKTYTIDHDGGSIQLKSTHFKAAK